MANMTSRVKHPLDGDLLSMDSVTTAQNANTDGTPIQLDRLNTAYWDNDELANSKVGVVIVVEADNASADVTYIIEVDTVVGMGSAVTAFTTTNLAVGSHTIYLDESVIEHLEAGTAYWNINVAVAAGTGGATVTAFQAPFAND